MEDLVSWGSVFGFLCYFWVAILEDGFPGVLYGLPAYNTGYVGSIQGFPGGPEVKNLPAIRRHRFDPWVRKIPCRRAWQLTPVFLPGESHGQRSLVGYSSQCRKWVGLDLVTKTTTIYLYNWNMKDVLRYLL